MLLSGMSMSIKTLLNRREFRRGLELLIVAVGIAWIASVTADVASQSIPLPLGVDPSLAWLQASGFPAWAVVVAWGVVKITNELRDITTRLDTYVNKTELRLSRIETQLRLPESL